MTNTEVARTLQQAARKIVVQHPNLYRIRAYRRAAQAVLMLNKEVAEMSQTELELQPGIGTHLAKCIVNYTRTGEWLTYDELTNHAVAA
jgi:DNA polymerase (family 10)